MRIYFSGIGGVGIGPLAEIALDAGYDVIGSDLKESELTKALTARGAAIAIGQDGSQITTAHSQKPIDWFVYTAALPADHPELVFATEHNIRASKRDELLGAIIKDKSLKLIAVSGTHGKTTTTGMLVWTLQQLGVPVSYAVGTTLSFGPSGKYDESSDYFVYECDEFDRNMLHFYPHLSVITSLDHDHFDTYPTVEDYRSSFVQFLSQSDFAVLWQKDLRYLQSPTLDTDLEAYDELMDLSRFTLAGDHNRHNAFLVERAILRLLPDTDEAKLTEVLNAFPGTDRRFEKLADNLYSDYGHHPTEIIATSQLAHELNGKIVLVYQPHQNIRQHQIKAEYPETMKGFDTIYWLPTYLSRETPGQAVLTPEELSANVTSQVVISDMNDALWDNIERERDAGKLVLIMGAGSIDEWLRKQTDTKKVANVLVTDTQGRFVMQKRDNKPEINNPGMVTGFGGAVEPGETMRQAAFRELQEETNLDCTIEQLKYFKTIFQPLVNDGTSRWVTYYLLKNQDISKLEVYEGAGYELVDSTEIDNFPLSPLAKQAIEYYIPQSTNS